MKDYKSREKTLTVRDARCETDLNSWRVEKSSNHVLTATVGRQVERGQTTLAGQFSHQALGLGCRDLRLS